MTYIVLTIAALILLAGIIAFAGDRLGAYIGRKRLSLFGLRPRTTGQVIGIGAGILIMLATIGVLAIMFQNATSTIVNFQRTVDELGQLRAQERVLSQRVARVAGRVGRSRSHHYHRKTSTRRRACRSRCRVYRARHRLGRAR